jgi:hypothetical protein
MRIKRRQLMLKTSFNLPNGTLVTIEGEPEDIKDLLDHYSGFASSESFSSTKQKAAVKSPKKETKPSTSSDITAETLTQIINLIKSCPEAEEIEKYILDKEKSSEANRALLPLYIIHEYLDNKFGITTVEIGKITADLGPKIKISRQNVLRALVRSSASKYVLGDKTRKAGTGTRYTLNDRGVKYIKSILANEKPEK